MSLPSLNPFRAGLLVAVLAILVYLNTLPNAFVMDDWPQLVENGFLRRSDGLQRIFTSSVWAFVGKDVSSNFYRPLMQAAWYLLWPVFGPDPAAYHALNILLHAGVSVVVFLWLRWIQPSEQVAWLAALLFAVHPIHTEAVAWVSALPDLQCAFFVLLGFWLYLRGERAGGAWRYGLAAGVAGCLLLSLLAKEAGLVLPVMLVLYELGRKRSGVVLIDENEGRISPRHDPRQGPHYILFAFSAMGFALAVYLGMRFYALGGLMPMPGFTPAGRILGWIALLYNYTLRVLYPTVLNSFHVIPAPGGVLSGQVLAGLAAGAGLSGLAVWLYWHKRAEWLSIPMFLVALAMALPATIPENGFAIRERYVYLPSAGFCWLAAALLHRISARTGWKPVAALAVALVGFYGARTVLRNQDWREEIPFYLGELRNGGEPEQLGDLLMNAYLRRGMAREALEYAEASVRRNPRQASAHLNLGIVYGLLKEPEKALAEYRSAADYARQNREPVVAAHAVNRIANAYHDMNRPDLAIPLYRDALRLHPNSANAHNDLGMALWQTGRLEEAIVELRAAIQLDPASATAHSNVGLFLAARNDLPGARAALGEALRLEPGSAETLARMGAVELRADNLPAARRFFAQALSLDPANTRARRGMDMLGR